jgi:hypothetical protein
VNHPRSIVRTAGAALLIATAAGAASAQVPNPAKSFRLKVGALLPSDGRTKDETQSTHLAGEIDLVLPVSAPGSQTILSLGYSQNSSGDRTLRTVPLTLATVRSAFNPVSGVTGNVYYGAGTGAYFVRATGGGQPTGDKVLFGGFLVAGYRTPAKLFVEAKYHLVGGSVEGLKPRGFSLFLGTQL